MDVLLVRQVLKVSILVDSLSSSRIQPVSSTVLIRAVQHVRADSHD
jgi:hypothetical protein